MAEKTTKADKVEEFAKNIQKAWEEPDFELSVDLKVMRKEYVMDLVQSLGKKFSKGQSVDLKET